MTLTNIKSYFLAAAENAELRFDLIYFDEFNTKTRAAEYPYIFVIPFCPIHNRGTKKEETAEVVVYSLVKWNAGADRVTKWDEAIANFDSWADGLGDYIQITNIAAVPPLLLPEGVVVDNACGVSFTCQMKFTC